MDEFIISAIPKIKDVHPIKLFIPPDYPPVVINLNFILKGGTFYSPHSIYLSANNDMFDNNLSYTLSASISGVIHIKQISAVLISEFNYNEHYIFFNLPQIPKTSGFFDIIVENEAGYGTLTTSINSEISAGVQIVDIY